MKRIALSLAGALALALSAVPLRAADTMGAPNQGSPAANSVANQSGGPTAQDQSNARSDIDLTAQIRRSIVADKQLSVSAQNVKIITSGGKVTLRGPVANPAEKDAVVRHAADAVGLANIDDQLQVK